MKGTNEWKRLKTDVLVKQNAKTEEPVEHHHRWRWPTGTWFQLRRKWLAMTKT